MNTKNISFLISFLFISLIGVNLNAQGIMIYKNSSSPIQISYSELDSIVTYEDEPPVLTGAVAEAIDLGLPSGTKWASWNVGATSPEEYGGYYAWGETEEKEDYSLSTYQHYDSTWQEYNNIGENISRTEYDVANVLWGNGWRMPTTEDIDELLTNCTWTWIQYNNSVYGYKVVGPNGNRIFLPAAGYRYATSFKNVGSYGAYYSATLNEDEDKYADCRCFNLDSYRINGKFSRNLGLSVRPVK